MDRIKWVPRRGFQRTSCGRFEICGSIFIGNSTYVRLVDNATGKEYPCRTESSAKTAARNILRLSGINEELAAIKWRSRP